MMKDGQAQKNSVEDMQVTTDHVEIRIVPIATPVEKFVLNAKNSEGVVSATLVRIAERIG